MEKPKPIEMPKDELTAAVMDWIDYMGSPNANEDRLNKMEASILDAAVEFIAGYDVWDWVNDQEVMK